MQFEPDLPNISLADVRLNAHGIALVKRDQLQDVLQVTSTQRLVVAIPGFSLKDLPESAVTHARKCNTTIVVHDPSLMRKELKNVTLFSLCEQDVKPKAHVASDDFVPAPTVELAVLIQRPNLEAVGIDWSAFTARLRSEVRQVVLAQLDSSHHCTHGRNSLTMCIGSLSAYRHLPSTLFFSILESTALSPFRRCGGLMNRRPRLTTFLPLSGWVGSHCLRRAPWHDASPRILAFSRIAPVLGCASPLVMWVKFETSPSHKTADLMSTTKTSLGGFALGF